MSKKRILVTLAVFAVSATLYAQNTKTVTSHDKSCQVTVPGSWTVSGSFGIANSPDNKVSVTVNSPLRTPSLSGTKQTAPMLNPADKVVKSTADEFQMEGRGMDNKPNVYRGIQLAGRVCIVEVTYESGTLDDARRIAMSLKGAQ
ncbi:MAG: hypothetical protein ABR976_17625 [Terracidiphilus sp.]|jgi:hypothetical protein